MWRKSSYSMSNGNCVEVDNWYKSSYSEGTNCVEWSKSSHCYTCNCVEWRKSTKCASNECVEVHGSQVRDSYDPDGTVLEFDRDTWTRFLNSLK